MGITIVRKSKPGQHRYDAKICLVLAGGAISGGAFKIGGLKALNDFLINRKVTDFDSYVGLSAGALLAAVLANGVGPEEMLRSLEGRSKHFSQLHPWEFYYPNFEEFIGRPIHFLWHVTTFIPSAILDLLWGLPDFRHEVVFALRRFRANPSWAHMEAIFAPLAAYVAQHIEIPNIQRELIPSGFFDNRKFESYLRHNLERNMGYNDFKKLLEKRRKELYIVATNLDTAERVVFGHDEVMDLTISQAVQASSALPGFYRPVRFGDVDYIDGGVRKTANVDVAIEKNAKLIIVYNPFRPIYNPTPTMPEAVRQRSGLRYLRDTGLITVLNQVLRTLLHTRLHLGIEQYRRDPHFDGDIILIEPTENDYRFFNINPVSFWMRTVSAEQGFRSTILSIEKRFDEIKSIFNVYGIEISRHFIREEVRRLKMAQDKHVKVRAILEKEILRRNIRLAKKPA